MQRPERRLRRVRSQSCATWFYSLLAARPPTLTCPQSGCSCSCAVSAAPLGFPSASASGWRPPDSLPAHTRQSSASFGALITAADTDDHVTAPLHASKNIERLVAFICVIDAPVRNSERIPIGPVAVSAVGDDRDAPEAIESSSCPSDAARRQNDDSGHRASDQSTHWNSCHGLLLLLAMSWAHLDDIDPGSRCLRNAARFLACSKPMSNNAFIC